VTRNKAQMISLRLVVDTNIVASAALTPDGLQRTVLLLAITKPAPMVKTCSTGTGPFLSKGEPIRLA
jgi:hypothetical protein